MAVRQALLLWAVVQLLLGTADGIWNVHSHHHVWAAARQGHIGASSWPAHAGSCMHIACAVGTAQLRLAATASCATCLPAALQVLEACAGWM